MLDNELDIYVIHHLPPKSHFHDTPKFMTPIQSGRALSKENFDMIGDNTKDNISTLNTSYGELSVHYWVWKNTKSKYIGFQHYRRFLNFSTKIQLPFSSKGLPILYYKKLLQKMANQSDILDSLSKYDLIIPTQDLTNSPIGSGYKKAHISQDWDITEKVLKESLRPSYLKYLDQFLNSYKFYPAILYYAHWEVFDELMNWLFPILNKIYDRISPSTDPYQSRQIAFIAERLLNLFYIRNIKDKQFKVKTLDFATFVPFKQAHLLDYIKFALA